MKRLWPLLLILGCAAPRVDDAWEAERQIRIRKDYNVTRDQLQKNLAERIKDFKPEELDRWEAEGRLDYRVFDGQKRYLYCSASNLFFRYADIRVRWAKPSNNRRKLELVRSIRRRAGSDVYFDPVTYRVTMTVKVKEDAVPKGELVRCWMPYPREYEAQRDVRFVSSTPPVKAIDRPDAPMRSVYFEADAREFAVTYEYTRYHTLFRLDPSKVREAPFQLGEQPPHVVFTPRLRKLVADIVGDERNPMLRARRLYDWCVINIQYSYAHEYSTIPNISEFCLEKRYGDCGQIALLFITMCRIAGVPARWQTSWMGLPDDPGIHDWTEIYLEPYGWVPVDPYEGQAMLHADDLTEDEKQEVRDFYFGGLDASRMAANSDHGAPLYPPKKTWRSDTVDFQRGELEWGNTNIYYDQFDYDLKAEVVQSQ